MTSKKFQLAPHDLPTIFDQKPSHFTYIRLTKSQQNTLKYRKKENEKENNERKLVAQRNAGSFQTCSLDTLTL